jgi:hypothetical protein
LGFEDGAYGSYCLNEAVYVVGTHITNELDSVKGKNQKAIQRGRQRVLDRYLGGSGPQTGKFADPAAVFAAEKALAEAAQSLEFPSA